MLNKLKNISNIQILSLFLVLFFIAEGINKICSFYTEELFLQKGVKFFAMVFVLALIFIQQKKKLVGLLALSMSFAIGQFFLEDDAFSWKALVGFSRYFFFLCLIVLPFIETKTKEINFLCKLFEYLVLLNSILILGSVIFQIEIFKSYSGSRFGYNGLFMASANSSYFYIIAIMYYLGLYRQKVFKKWDWWLLVAAVLFLGTKAVLFSLFFFGIVAAYFFCNTKKQKVGISIGIVGLGLLTIILIFTTGIFARIAEKDGLLSAVLSYRNNLFVEQTLPYIHEHWSAINFFFGGTSNPAFRPQLEYIDLFLYFGGIGAFLYLYLLVKDYFKDYRPDKMMFLCFLILFAVTSIAGNFFYNASVPIYLIVLKYALKNQKAVQKSE